MMNATMSSPIQIGSTCIIQGLISQPAFNGHTVRVLQYDHANARFTVSPMVTPSPLPSSLAVRPQNLVLTSPTITNHYEPGTRCVLQGLETAAFNGHQVSIIQFLLHEQRYQVKSEAPGSPLPPILHIKPENLCQIKVPAPQMPVTGPGPIENLPSRRDLMEGYRSQLSSTSLSQSGNSQFLRRVPSTASLSGGSMHGGPSFRDSRSVQSLRQGFVRSGSAASLDPSFVSFRSRPMERMLSASSVVSRAPVALIPEGSKALLQGLQFQPSLNGTVVKVLEYVSNMRRYRVVAAPTDESPERFMVVQPHNLLPVLEMDNRSDTQSAAGGVLFRAGDKVVLKNLCAQPTLNDSVATVKAYIRETDRYLIQIDDNPLEVMMLKARNLKGLDEEDGVKKEVGRPALRRTPSSGTVASRVSTSSQSTRRRDLAYRDTLERKLVHPFVPLEHGTRVVLHAVEDKPILSGELASVLLYVPTSKSYSVRLLGAKAIEGNGYVDECLVEPDSLTVVTESCFWAFMKQKGKGVRVPASCEFMTGTRQLRLRIDAFAGVDGAVPAARLLLGEILCDWSSHREVVASLYENPTPPLKFVKIPTANESHLLQEDEILVDVALASKNAFFKALIEYQLLRPTGSYSGAFQIFKVCFPFPRKGDDENPFCDGSPVDDGRPTDVVSWSGGDCLSVVSSVDSNTFASERRRPDDPRSSRPRTRAKAREQASLNNHAAHAQAAEADPDLELYEKYDSPPPHSHAHGRKDPDPGHSRSRPVHHPNAEGLNVSMSSLSSVGTSDTSGVTVEGATAAPPPPPPAAKAPPQEKKDPLGPSGHASDRSPDPPADPTAAAPGSRSPPRDRPPPHPKHGSRAAVAAETESETEETDSRAERRERRKREKKARKKEERREREERKALKKSQKRVQKHNHDAETPTTSADSAAAEEVNMKSIACLSSSWNWTDQTIDGEGLIH